MAMRGQLRVAAIFVVMVSLLLSARGQSQQTFEARLTPVPVDGTTRDEITGIGSVSATLVGSRLAITGSFEGLQGPATAARLHRGLATGVRGSAFQELTVSNETAGTVSGSLTLTPDQADSLRKGQIYVQIDSERGPDGNLWGWLLD
jgi:hypothetical protein